ncbi:hypothetical protein [Desulfitobacterium metallireducens]|uniref:hypothetical protein n=1 Tax=Desulfitobacterium metallireducens TaxID=142877 RepID=UPI0002F924A5|nr:hypothetical protein [Desulfitobacterium metallireducens]
MFLSIYPIFIGIFLALPNFISKAEDKEVGQLTAIGHYAPPQFVLWLNQFNQAVTISGVVFG